MLMAQIGVILFNVAILSSILSSQKTKIQKIIYFVIGAIQIYAYVSLIKKPNYYQSYNITRNYDVKTLKQAYKNVMLEYHPDKNSKIDADQFNYLKNINEILKQDEKRYQYDAYGVVQENNIDPLPAVIHKIRISRIICYMIMFLIILVNAKESKQNKKTLAIILMALGYGDLQLMESPQWFQQSLILPTLTLFEFHVVYRILVTLIVSYFVTQEKSEKRNQALKIQQLDTETIDKLVKEHQEKITNLESKKQKTINLFVMIAIILHTASEHFNFTPIIANFISSFLKQEDL